MTAVELEGWSVHQAQHVRGCLHTLTQTHVALPGQLQISDFNQ